MDQVKFAHDSLLKNWSDIVCLGRPYHFKFFKDCLPQSLLDPFLDTLSQVSFEQTLSLSIFTTGGVILISNSMNLKQEETKFNARLIKTVLARKIQTRFFLRKKKTHSCLMQFNLLCCCNFIQKNINILAFHLY